MKKTIFILGFAVIMTAFFACNSATTENNGKENTTTDMKNESSIQLVEASFEVGGSCGMCKDRIEKTAKNAGAETAEWDKETKILKVKHKEGFDLTKVHKAVSDVGHDTKIHKANDEVYNKLPDCCKYR